MRGLQKMQGLGMLGRWKSVAKWPHGPTNAMGFWLKKFFAEKRSILDVF
jgi:hypothetical protein